MLSPDQIKARAGKLRARVQQHSIPEPNTGCWLWIGAVLKNGYGVASRDGRSALAHRVSYEAHIGPIPDGMHLDHLCRMRCCVNPDHLEPVTPAENLRRGEGQKPHAVCRRGHPMTPDNLVYDNGHIRRCATCSRAKNNRYYAMRTANA